MMDMEQAAICKKLLDSKKAEILERMNKFTENNSPIAKEICRVRDGKKQFNDVSEAANRASCVEEFKLYISYKSAKEGTRTRWGVLAEKLNKQVDELKEIAEEIQKAAKEDQKTVPPLEDVYLEVLRSYMGYLMWRANVLITANMQNRAGGER